MCFFKLISYDISDFEDDEWPDFPGDNKLAFHNGMEGSFRRVQQRRRSESVFYNMTVILAAVATGFDIRILNTTKTHPRCQGASDGSDEAMFTPVHKRASTSSDSSTVISRDAYFLAVRDQIIEPEPDYQDYHISSTAEYPHNTFHGIQTRYRPSVNFDVPIRFAETLDSTGHPMDTRTTPSTTGSVSPRKSSRSSDTDNDVALISLSPSQDKAFAEYQRQVSDTSSSVFETPKTTPKTTPQRYVQFEDGIRHSPPSYSHRRSPSNTSSSSIPSHSHSTTDYDNYEYVIKPPPPRRQNSNEPHGTPERPGTLNIIPRPRPVASILRKTSPVHQAICRGSPRGRVTPTPSSDNISRGSPRGRVTPTPSDSISAGGDDTSYMSARSGTSPGSTPPHIEHSKTLLDIDVEGQHMDATQPLPAKRNMNSKPSLHNLEREFLLK